MKTSAHRAPAILVPLAAVVLAATLPLAAQTTVVSDPANLAGERVSPQDLADTLPINHGALALEQLLRKLRTRASFMFIVAHPDDEDNGGLTYLSRGQGARVATLTLNRGEGGQNLMSADFEDALGLIRTQELLACDRYMDVDQFFGTEVDFGFSKTKEESFAKWTHERVLYDAVRAIRLYRPLVIASTFIGAPSDGHGQHQVAGEIAQEAFKAAADPNVFPDQIAAGLQPWQALKVYARSPFGRIDAQGMYDYATNQYVPARFTNYVSGKVTETVPKANVILPEGDADPLLGEASYAEFGREGRILQRSQMTGGAGPAGRGGGGRFDVSYHRYGSKLNQPDGDDSGLESGFFAGIDTSLAGITTLLTGSSETNTSPSGLSAKVLHDLLDKIDTQLADAQQKFNPAEPGLIAPQLREALRMLDGSIKELDDPKLNSFSPAETYNLLHELRIKRVQLNDALVLADGITLDAEFTPSANHKSLLTTAQRVDVTTVLSAGGEPVDVESVDLQFIGKPVKSSPSPGSPASRGPARLQPHSVRRETLRTLVDKELPPTRPYFSRPNLEQPYYDIADPALRNAPATPPPLVASATLNDHGVQLTVDAIVADPSETDPRQPVVIVPPVSVNLAAKAAVISVEDQTFWMSYSAMNPEPEAAPTFHLDLPQMWSYTLPPEANPQHMPPPATGRHSRETALVKTWDPKPYQPYPITVIAELDGRSYREGFRRVGYPGLEGTNFYTPSVFQVSAVDLQTAPNLNVAYLPGTGDDVPGALEDLGVHAHMITVADLTLDTLKHYDAVILGVRAYTAHADLAAANPALNEYAANGGIVIAQYNSGRLPGGTGPYPLDLGSSQTVIEEDAPVRILAPAYPLLTWPNQITPADFRNWIEERGHGFMSTWDPHYTPLLETHDHGQQPQLGGLLVARTGRGAWIYLGLALYRQLPEGVPGPYRLFANLISAARNAKFSALPATPPAQLPTK